MIRFIIIFFFSVLFFEKALSQKLFLDDLKRINSTNVKASNKFLISKGYLYTGVDLKFPIWGRLEWVSKNQSDTVSGMKKISIRIHGDNSISVSYSTFSKKEVDVMKNKIKNLKFQFKEEKNIYDSRGEEYSDSKLIIVFWEDINGIDPFSIVLTKKN